jgi:hypothetical protein
MTYKPFKFVVTAVVLNMDDPITEIEANPVTLYGVEALKEFADNFEDQLATATVTEPVMDGRAT